MTSAMFAANADCAAAIAATNPTEDTETRFRRTMTRLFDGRTSV